MNRLSSWGTAAASLQWLFFIFANTVVVPISVGAAFGLPQEEIASILRSALIFTGIACVLQGWIGHRYPLMEGPSGVIWGLILNLSVAASAMGMSLTSIGGGIATGMILAGVVVLLLGLFNLLTFIQRIFTPMVMSVYLFLLTFQLILIFFEGMLKVGNEDTLNIPVSLFSFGVVILVSLLKIKGKPTVSNFAILIGMVAGWVLYLMLFPSEQGTAIQSNGGLLLFPFGSPNLNIGIILITFLASMINLSNTIASVRAASQLLGKAPTDRQFLRSYMLTGSYSVTAGVFGLVSYAPFASSVGFLESTRIFNRKPFLIGGGLMSLLGIIPALGGVLATLPITVGNAVLFVAYLQLFGTSLKSLGGYQFNSVTIHRLAGPVLVGVGIMFVDPSLFNQLPVLLQPLVSNGFIVGVLVAILLEKLINWEKYEESSQELQAMKRSS
ncbi:xanthine permease [Thalassobacillus devorans]|uniref:Xanthine permease n=1 Tax=Thalassobacillus devorans TaxID=279813 RepID=A0ABQ1PLN1_9BACI|nr:uracil/xanthine transporter [Thalassobacillus devorans]NIK30224.1 xanthine/uracil permease [Thalassobacillus devorans]GGC99387.1 xanthine permease [Thalassobacillus devorans]